LLAESVLDNYYKIERDKPITRRVIEIDVIRYSFDLLDLITSNPQENLIDLVEAYYLASIRAGENRRGEAIILSWSAIEQISSIIWKSMIFDENSHDGTSKRVNKSRLQKLDGRDYTASVQIEILELKGKVNFETYSNLEIARKARNAWAHNLKQPSNSDIGACMDALNALFDKVFDLKLRLQSGAGGGSVPQWPLWMWEKRHGPFVQPPKP
jgi:hypothetical protein